MPVRESKGAVRPKGGKKQSSGLFLAPWEIPAEIQLHPGGMLMALWGS